MTEIVQHKGITIANTLIATDSEGRFRLNDLHQAAGGERRHGPSLWLENEKTKALAEEMTDTEIPVSVIKGGLKQGTYVCRELARAWLANLEPYPLHTVAAALQAYQDENGEFAPVPSP